MPFGSVGTSHGHKIGGHEEFARLLQSYCADKAKLEDQGKIWHMKRLTRLDRNPAA